MPQNDVTTGRRPEPRAVGAAMPHGLAHPDDEIRSRTTVPGRNADDPAHASASPPWRRRAAEGEPEPGRQDAAEARRVPIGRESCREGEWRNVCIWVVAVSLKKKQKTIGKNNRSRHIR